MALTVEDGTGVAGAESYVTVAAFRSWATNRGHTLPVLDADVEALLRKGTDYIERKNFIGEIEYTDQPLAFPRLLTDSYGVTTSTGIPAKLKTAQMSLALEAIKGPLTLAARPGLYSATKIDAIYLKYVDAGKGSGDVYFKAVDDLLAEWLSYGGAVIRTVRA